MSQNSSSLRRNLQSALANKQLANTLLDDIVSLQTKLNLVLSKLDVDSVSSLDTNYVAAIGLTTVLDPSMPLVGGAFKATYRQALRAGIGNKRVADQMLTDISAMQTTLNVLLAKLDAQAGVLSSTNFVSSLSSVAFNPDALTTFDSPERASYRAILRSALTNRNLADDLLDAIAEIEITIDSALVLLDAHTVTGTMAGLKVAVLAPDGSSQQTIPAPVLVPNNAPVNVNMPTGFNSSSSYSGQQQTIMLVTPAGSLFSSTGPGSYFTLNTGGNSNKYYVWYSVSGGSNTDPTPVGLTGIQVTVLSGDTAAQVAVKTNAALAALAAATTSVSGSTVTVVPTAVTAQAATPTFSPAAGTFGVTQSVAISSATAGASIYYTTDGSTPTIASTLYSTSVSVAVSETLKAIAVKSGFANSAIGTSVYVIGGTQVATPTFFPVAGTYSGTQNVAVSSLTSGAAFYYTVDGTTPTTGSTLYTGPIVVNASETVKVLATHSGLTNSAIATAVYSITALGPAALNLGTSTNPQAASYYRILSESGISTTAGSAITGNIGVTPIAATAITGFGLVGTDADTSYTSTLVSGLVFAASNASPTSANLGDALGVANAAYTDAAGRTGQTGTNLGSAGEIGGLTLQPGLYKWTTAVTISSTLTLNGGVNDVFIAQISGSLGLANGIHVVLTGGMKASNVFWQTSGAVTLGTTSIFNGILLSATNIAVQTGATVHGALYAQTAVTLDDNAVSA